MKALNSKTQDCKTYIKTFRKNELQNEFSLIQNRSRVGNEEFRSSPYLGSIKTWRKLLSNGYINLFTKTF